MPASRAAGWFHPMRATTVRARGVIIGPHRLSIEELP
jgi:hypothetical protein